MSNPRTTQLPADAPRAAGAPSRPRLFGRAVRRIHCFGIGGMGLGPLAIYLARLGFEVSGEDDAPAGEMAAELARAGIALGPLPEACDLVVHSSALGPHHPSLRRAQALGVPGVRRGELLAEVTRERRLVAVCGSHGKTTTTAMLAAALRAVKFSSGYVLGGRWADATPPAEVGDTDWVVVELDESDGTIACFAPEITVAVNLDWDHPDHYPQRSDLEAAFGGLFRRTRGAVLTCHGCAMSQRVVQAVAEARAEAGGKEPGPGGPRWLTFGRAGDFCSRTVQATVEQQTLELGGRFALAEAVVRAGGEFNATNATAALAAAELMGAPLTRAALQSYPGVRRRQTVLHAGAFTVIEDYAHHPAEIRALLGALRERVAGGGRLIVVFQPHRFSRTAQFKADFAQALAGADVVHLLEVYGAGEKPIAGGATADVFAELQRGAPGLPVSYHPGGDGVLVEALAREVRDGDLVAFVGAGDIDRKARRWLARRPPTVPDPAAWDGIAAALAGGVSAASRLRREEPLAPKTTMRVGGAARLFAEPAGIADLQALLRGAAARKIEVLLLGRGSNLIVPDEGVDGVVIALTQEVWAGFEPRGDGRVWVGAGLRLKHLCGLAAKAGLAGFEFLEGIPGSVGGALRMNAGAMGSWIFDRVEEVRLMTRDAEVRTLPRAAMHVDYRHCAELQDAIALGALLRAGGGEGADTETIARQVDVYRRKRHESQPREPSAGCIFKNPPGDFAGRLIDQCGLKGRRVGDAEVSIVHANFIVNRGAARAADVLELIRQVRAQVRERRGIELQPEVLLYGRQWEDVL